MNWLLIYMVHPAASNTDEILATLGLLFHNLTPVEVERGEVPRVTLLALRQWLVTVSDPS